MTGGTIAATTRAEQGHREGCNEVDLLYVYMLYYYHREAFYFLFVHIHIMPKHINLMQNFHLSANNSRGHRKHGKITIRLRKLPQ